MMETINEKTMFLDDINTGFNACTDGTIMRTLTDGVYKIIEMWTSGGNKILRMELKGMRLHGRCTEWNNETGDIIYDEYYQDGHRIDIHCNRLY